MRIEPTGYVAGTWKATCDRCGENHRNTQLRLEWTGLRVCRECFEVRNAQDFLRGKEDRQAPAWVRPEPDPVDVGTVTPDDL
jgi:ribosome-binding protein aMBF1 (putative translation factor)